MELEFSFGRTVSVTLVRPFFARSVCTAVLSLIPSLFIVGIVHSKEAPTRAIVDLPPILERSVIRATYRDTNGFLWIAGQDALHKYDGSKVVSYGPTEAGSRHLPVKQVLTITEDLQGRLIAGTGDGVLLVWDAVTQSFDRVSKFGDCKLRFIKFVRASSSGELWIGSDRQLLLLDVDFKPIKRWTFGTEMNSTDFPQHSILTFIEDEKGRAVVVTKSSLLTLSAKKSDFKEAILPDLDSTLSPAITVIIEHDKGQYFIGTDTGHIALIDSKTLKVLSARTLNTGGLSKIHSAIVLPDGILIGSDSGLHWVSNDLSTIETVKSANGTNTAGIVYSLLKDHSGAIAGTYSGLQVYIFSGFDAKTLNEEKNQNYISKISQDAAGRTWIASHSGLFLYDSTNEAHIPIGRQTDQLGIDGLTDQRVASITIQNGEIVWIAPVRGKLQRYDYLQNKFEAIELPGAEHFQIPDVHFVDQWDELWVATYRHGLYRITDEGIESFLQNDRLKESQLLKIFSAKNGDMLFFNFDDTYFYKRDSDSFDKLTLKNERGDYVRILAVQESKSADLWIATEHNGLFVWHSRNRLAGAFEMERPADSSILNQVTIVDMQFDEFGHLWLTTPREIFKVEDGGRNVNRLPTADTLIGGEFSWAGSFRSENGTLFFPAINSYIKFHPDEIELDLTPPNTVLSAIHFPDTSYINILPPQDQKTIEISPFDHFVTFEFSVDDFIGYRENQFRYRLEGFDPEWRENGFKNSATYTNLPSGNYTLRAMGASAGGIWDETGISIPVKVLPPPWRSWWAHTLYTLVAMLAVWAAHRTYKSYLIEKEIAALAQEMNDNAEQAEDEMQEQLEFQDELLQSAYTHKVDTLAVVKAALGVSAITGDADNNLAITTDTRSSERVLSALTLLEDCMFYGAGGPSGDINKFVELCVSQVFEESPIDADSVVTINEISPTLFPAPVCSVLAVVLYELLKNCAQHAFDPASHANFIQLKIIESRDSRTASHIYQLTVSDSGSGIPSDLFSSPAPESGAATILAILGQFGGEAKVLDGPNSAAVITIVDERIEPYV